MSAPPIALTRLARHMERWHRQGYWPYHLFVPQEAVEQASHEGYLALAQLIKARYFSVIVTTNSNGQLEHHLKNVGLNPPVLSIDEDADEPIFQALEDLIDKACIIKLSQGYEDKTTNTAPLSSTLRMAIQRYLSRDLIVVGPVTPNSKLMELIQPAESGSMYYCIHEQPSSDDSIVQLLQLKYSSKEDFLISGDYGHFDAFFKTIVSLLSLKETSPAISLDALSSRKPRKDAHSKKNTSVAAPGHLSSAKYSLKADILLVTVTEIETQAILNCFPSPEKHIIDQQVYYDLGHIGPARTVMLRSTHMGPFAAIHCVEEGIRHISPHAVIMVGIAFGLRPNEQKIGDILVAMQIMNCDFQKIWTRPDNQSVINYTGSVPPVPREQLYVLLLALVQDVAQEVL